jgi:hypothetical protein
MVLRPEIYYPLPVESFLTWSFQEETGMVIVQTIGHR